MGLTDCYTLEGRENVGEAEKGYGLPASPCIFCGEVIRHFNDGGVGWCLSALKPDGTQGRYLYCDQPSCAALTQARKDNQPVTVDINDVSEKDQVVFRCGCVPDYTESVGERCSECRADRDHLVPWDDVPVAMLPISWGPKEN